MTGTKGLYVSDKRSHQFYTKAEDAARAMFSGLAPDASKGFKPVRGHSDGGYDDEGWLYPGDRLMDSVTSMVDAIEKGVEPKASGKVQHKSLEVSIAMRESARRGHTPVKLPLEDRSLTLMPESYRWDNKKELFGKDRYASEIGAATKGGVEGVLGEGAWGLKKK